MLHGPQPGVRSLDVSTSGKAIHLLSGEYKPHSKTAELHSVRSDDGGATWSAPVRVDAGNRPAFGLRRGNDAQIAAFGEKLIAVWQSPGTDAWGGGPMATALSSDGGKTWKPGPNPADDRSTEGHNFIDIAADSHGAFHLVWLDNRAGKRGLRGATSTDDGRTWSANQTIAPETCECCLNTLLASPQGGAWVLYRAKSPRDMASASLTGGMWKSPVTVGAFGWQFNGCPEVGSGMCIGPEGSLHAAVWSGMENRAGVYHLTSRDAGATWSEPQPLGGSIARNPAAASSPSGAIAIVWDSVENDVPCVRGSISKDGGKTWRDSVLLSPAKASAQHPRVVAVESGFRVFWTEAQNDGSPKWASALLSEQ